MIIIDKPPIRPSVCSACCSLPHVARNQPIGDQARDKQRRDRPGEVGRVAPCVDPRTFADGYRSRITRHLLSSSWRHAPACPSRSTIAMPVAFSTFPTETSRDRTAANCRVVSRAQTRHQTGDYPTAAGHYVYVTLHFVLSFFFVCFSGTFIKIYIGDTRASLRRI